MKKVLLILLSLIMVVSVFASCGGTEDKTTPKPTTPKDPGKVDKETPEEEQLNVDIDSIDYEGEMVYMVHWDTGNSTYDEFGMEEDQINNDAVNDSLYKRNLYTEQALGIDLEFVGITKSNYVNVSNFLTKLETRKADVTTPIDIIASQGRVMPYVILEGFLTDLNVYSDSLDLSKAWWPQNCKEACEIKDKLYFVSGDISANLLRSMIVLFVNKTTLGSLGYDYDEFMKSIVDYEWTFDGLIEMTNNCYQPLDAIAEPSEGDKFGLVTLYYLSDALFEGIGYRFLVKSNKDGEIFRLSNQMATEAVDGYVQKLKDWKETNNFHMPYNEGYYKDVFKNGNALFLLDYAWVGFDLQKTDIKYAVIPAPALDVNQKEYFTVCGGGFTVYGICDISEDYDRAAQTLQVLGYNAYSTTTPALFEVSFKGKFAKDDYAIEMFDLIREGLIFDVGKIYDSFIAEVTSGGEAVNDILPNIVSRSVRDDKVWATEFNPAGRQKLVRDQIKRANEKLLDYAESDN